MSLKDSIRIMVVDDMSISRALITQSLEEIGVQHIGIESDPKAALGKLAAQPVHLVISDMNMPGMDGLQLLSTLRQSPRTAKVGFLLITGRANNEIISEGKRLGMNNLVAKPFENKDLLRAVEAIVGRI